MARMTERRPTRLLCNVAPLIEVVIPPRATAQPSVQFENKPCTRDTLPLIIQSLGRLDWREATSYGKRALVETTMGPTKPLSDRGFVRATGLASKLKRPSR